LPRPFGTKPRRRFGGGAFVPASTGGKGPLLPDLTQFLGLTVRWILVAIGRPFGDCMRLRASPRAQQRAARSSPKKPIDITTRARRRPELRATGKRAAVKTRSLFFKIVAKPDIVRVKKGGLIRECSERPISGGRARRGSGTDPPEILCKLAVARDVGRWTAEGALINQGGAHRGP